MERVNLKRQNITKANYAIIQLLSFVLPFMETITDLEVVGKGFIQKDNIKKLTIIGDVPISVLERILKRCSTVTHLKLNKCINVNDECVSYILSKVTVSEELSIYRCFNITRLPYVSSSKKVDVKTKKCWRLEYYDIIETHEDLIEFVLFSAYISTHEVEDEIIYARLNLYCITDKIQSRILQLIRYHNLNWEDVEQIDFGHSSAPMVTFRGFEHEVCFLFSRTFHPLPQLIGIAVVNLRQFIH